MTRHRRRELRRRRATTALLLAAFTLLFGATIVAVLTAPTGPILASVILAGTAWSYALVWALPRVRDESREALRLHRPATMPADPWRTLADRWAASPPNTSMPAPTPSPVEMTVVDLAGLSDNTTLIPDTGHWDDPVDILGPWMPPVSETAATT